MTARESSAAAIFSLLLVGLPGCEEMGYVDESVPLQEQAVEGQGAESEALQVPQAPVPQFEGLGLLGDLGEGHFEGGGDAVEAMVEDAPERVTWTISETALRHYVDWQKHVSDSEALAEIAEQVVGNEETFPEWLREQAGTFVEAETPEQSFARFGLAREEVTHIEQIWIQLAEFREGERSPTAETLAQLRASAGSTARQFLAAVQEHSERAMGLRASGLRAEYGDANIDLILKYQASLPQFPKMLGEGEVVDEGPAPAAEVEPSAEAPSEPAPSAVAEVVAEASAEPRDEPAEQ